MKKIILKTLIIAVIILAIALGVLGLMKLLNVDTIEGLQAVCNNNATLSYTIIVVLQIIQVIFIPISNQLITIPAIAVIGMVPAFFCSWIGIEIGTVVLYFIGKYGGGKLLAWVLSDKEKAKKYEEILKTRRLFYPVGMLIGVIPDDLLTTTAGIAKINFWYVLIVSIITRGVCVACTVFSFGILIKTLAGKIILVIGFILLCVLGYVLIKYGDKIEDKIWKKKKN